MTRTTSTTRSAALLGGLALLFALVACSSGTEGATPETPAGDAAGAPSPGAAACPEGFLDQIAADAAGVSFREIGAAEFGAVLGATVPDAGCFFQAEGGASTALIPASELALSDIKAEIEALGFGTIGEKVDAYWADGTTVYVASFVDGASVSEQQTILGADLSAQIASEITVVWVL